MDGDDDFQRNSNNFMSWLRGLDGVDISPKIQLADLRSRGAGRGVVALEDIESGEELFSIPHNVVLSAANSDLKEYLHEKLEQLEPWLKIILVLIYEHGKGGSSKWRHYWAVLPTTFNTLMYWADAELVELQGCAVLQKLGKDDANEQFESILLPIVTSNRDLFGLHSLDFGGPYEHAKAVLLALAHRMATLVMSYAFDLERQEEDADEEGYVSDDEEDPAKGMVPLADMLNADGSANNAKLHHNESKLSMVSMERIVKGEEILNDYGDLPRSDLLRRYGYITDTYSQYDVVEIATSRIIALAATQCNLSQAEIQRRQSGDLRGLRDVFAKSLSPYSDLFEESYDLQGQYIDGQVFPPALLLTIMAIVTEDRDLDGLRRSGKRALQSCLSDLKVLYILHALLDDRLKEYKTTIAEDARLVEGSSVLPLRLQQALQIRLKEKDILATAKDYVGACINGQDVDPEIESVQSDDDGRFIKKQRV